MAQDGFLRLPIRLGADVDGSVGDGLKLRVGVENASPGLSRRFQGGFQFAFVRHDVL